jgi:hypothetical protein
VAISNIKLSSVLFAITYRVYEPSHLMLIRRSSATLHCPCPTIIFSSFFLSAELSEAINSMFRWYKDAAKCYVYLSDVSISDRTKHDQSFQKSRWFTRGWTLQELVAPASVEFFSLEGERIGNKDLLVQEIAAITGISNSSSSRMSFSKSLRISRYVFRKTPSTLRNSKGVRGKVALGLVF